MKQNQFQHIDWSKKIKIFGIGGCGVKILHEITEFPDNVEIIKLDSRNSYVFKEDLLGSEMHERLNKVPDHEELINMDSGDPYDVYDKLTPDIEVVILLAGLGGDIGSRVREIAKAVNQLGISCFSIVTLPFPFEGKKRRNISEEVLLELAKYSLEVYFSDNRNLLGRSPYGTSLDDAFKMFENDCISLLNSLINSSKINKSDYLISLKNQLDPVTD